MQKNKNLKTIYRNIEKTRTEINYKSYVFLKKKNPSIAQIEKYKRQQEKLYKELSKLENEKVNMINPNVLKNLQDYCNFVSDNKKLSSYKAPFKSKNIMSTLIISFLLLFNRKELDNMKSKMPPDEVYNYLNNNNRSLFDPELFYTLNIENVTLLVNDIYFEDRNITEDIISKRTLEEQLEYIQSLQLYI